MFALGVLICYFLIFPLTFRFLGDYHVSSHAIVIILIVAAIITPTSDVFTLSLVALPMWLLYEASIFIVKRAKR